MVNSLLVAALCLLAVLLSGAIALVVYVLVRYTPIVGRIFEEKPVFLPLRADRDPTGEDMRFGTADGLSLAGTYFRARTPDRLGQIVFCHEFLGDRFSALAYGDHLRDLGFDIFCFDFRNHGQSDADPRYEPLQWVTDHEVADLRGALSYVRSRPDADPAGVGLFGISRGGSAALCVAGSDPAVWAVITDGAFPTRGTLLAYMHRWAEIYVGLHRVWRRPAFRWGFNKIIDIVGSAGLITSQWRRGCRFPSVERALRRLSPRPWFLIHGADDTYIGLDIARGFFAVAKPPKEMWVVGGAKHSRCREADPEGYATQVAAFLQHYAPRPPRKSAAEPLFDPEPRRDRAATGATLAPAAGAALRARQTP
ncbi:MAG TPA: alpha/beta fold hydrolase [Isosphaeraceae bacterium]|nr:alpha/beta fold hydrolase [Isosphaeraceae bacterium]